MLMLVVRVICISRTIPVRMPVRYTFFKQQVYSRGFDCYRFRRQRAHVQQLPPGVALCEACAVSSRIPDTAGADVWTC